MKLISIIIPVFNDGRNIFPVISTLIFTIQREFELIIVYDSDKDITLNTLEYFRKTYCEFHAPCDDERIFIMLDYEEWLRTQPTRIPGSLRRLRRLNT